MFLNAQTLGENSRGMERREGREAPARTGITNPAQQLEFHTVFTSPLSQICLFLSLHHPRGSKPTQIPSQDPLQSSRQPENIFSLSFSQISAPGGKSGVVPAPSQPPKLSLFFSRAVNPDTELFFPLLFPIWQLFRLYLCFGCQQCSIYKPAPDLSTAESGTELTDTKVWVGKCNL